MRSLNYGTCDRQLVTFNNRNILIWYLNPPHQIEGAEPKSIWRLACGSFIGKLLLLKPFKLCWTFENCVITKRLHLLKVGTPPTTCAKVRTTPTQNKVDHETKRANPTNIIHNRCQSKINLHSNMWVLSWQIAPPQVFQIVLCFEKYMAKKVPQFCKIGHNKC